MIYVFAIVAFWAYWQGVPWWRRRVARRRFEATHGRANQLFTRRPR